jgi:anti-sigma regulatory factor (Ser/Thr protein kinase)
MKEIALHIMDIVQNSIRAVAREISVTVEEVPSADILTLTIADNGSGMDEETCRWAADPWFTSRTTRRVGMGLPLLQMNATLAGGTMKITSAPGKGTTVTATFGYNHYDRPPLGDVSGTIALLIFANPAINIIYSHSFEGTEWSISSREIKEELGEEAVTDLAIVRSLKEIISENVREIAIFKE